MVIELTDCFHFTQITEKTRNFPSKIGNFQHLPRFRSFREALWIQIFVFLQPMQRQERSGLSASKTFQPQGG